MIGDQNDIRPEKIFITRNHEEACRITGGLIVDASKTAVRERGVFHFCLSGGSTPKLVYELLSEKPFSDQIRWDITHFYWGDERCVPPDSAESNFRLAYDALLSHIPVKEQQVHRIKAEDPDIDKILHQASSQFPEQLDLMLLGLGDDGHTASLFPGSFALNVTEKKLVLVTGPMPPNPRITITPHMIDSARNIFVLATGKSKVRAVKNALEGEWNPDQIPAQFARRGIWILDKESASKIKQ